MTRMQTLSPTLSPTTSSSAHGLHTLVEGLTVIPPQPANSPPPATASSSSIFNNPNRSASGPSAPASSSRLQTFDSRRLTYTPQAGGVAKTNDCHDSRYDKCSGSPNSIFATGSPLSLQDDHRPGTTTSDSARLEDFLYNRGFLQGTCSDVTIIAFDTRYRLHRLILDRSPFFSSCFNGGPWVESTSSEITLDPQATDPNIQQHAFEIALARLYGHVDREKEDTHALALLAAASYLELSDLTESCVGSLLRNLKTSNVSEVIKFVTNNYFGLSTDRLLESAKALLYRDGWEIPYSGWDGISGEVVAEIVGYEGFYIPTEYARYCFVKNLVDWRIRQAYGISNEEAGKNTRALSLASSIQSSESYEDDADIQPLQNLLETGIYYVHMSFEELQKINEDRDVLGRPPVPDSVTCNALWQQMLLRQKVVNAPLDSAELEITKTEPFGAQTSLDKVKYFIPTEDSTTVIGDCPDQAPPVVMTQRALNAQHISSASASSSSAAAAAPEIDEPMPLTSKESDHPSTPVPELRYSQFPPFRFSAEFKGVRTLKERKRVYSKTVFYAGSYWNIYIQKVKSPKNVQLGVYLHRAKDRDGNGSSRDATSSEVTQIATLDERGGLLERHAGDMGSDTTTLSADPDTTRTQGANISASRASPRVPTPTESSPALGHYVDSRPMIQTYFKIFSPSRKGKMLSMFSSGPDSFNFSQSWGWKSSSLILEEGGLISETDRDARLRFMVVLGNV